MKAYIVDDEPLAVSRLKVLLAQQQCVEIAGTATDPVAVLDFLSSNPVDLLFLDIQMPGINGFELLARLEKQPPVIFTTAYDEYALKAFEVNSVDYLLKPVDPDHLKRALNKIMQFRDSARPTADDFDRLLTDLAGKLAPRHQEPPSRIGTRIGDRIQYVDLDQVTHFFSEDKLTFAATVEGKNHIVDYSISDLEQKLNDRDFLRVHRSTLLNLRFVHELHRWFGGKMLVRMNDRNRTELKVSRERTAALKQRLGL